MKSSNNNFKDRSWLEENNIAVSINFDFGELDENPLFEGAWGEILKNAIHNYLTKNIIHVIEVMDTMTDEERKALLCKALHGKSFRQIGYELGIDKKTAKSRFESAVQRLEDSPLVNIDFVHKNRKIRK